MYHINIIYKSELLLCRLDLSPKTSSKKTGKSDKPVPDSQVESTRSSTNTLSDLLGKRNLSNECSVH